MLIFKHHELIAEPADFGLSSARSKRYPDKFTMCILKSWEEQQISWVQPDIKVKSQTATLCTSVHEDPSHSPQCPMKTPKNKNTDLSHCNESRSV